jgi:hypothetical protein
MKLPPPLIATSGTQHHVYLSLYNAQVVSGIQPEYVSFFNNLYARRAATRNNIIAILQGAAGSVGNYANSAENYAGVITGWHTSDGDVDEHLTVRLYRGSDNSLRRTCHVYRNGTAHCN